VGLFSYNTPNIYEAVKESGRLGKVKIVGFDEADETLRGIQEGHIYGTVVQSPYRYGYESVRILTALAKGDKTVIPASKFVDVPAKVIRKAEVDAFWKELKELVK
jgi:ribose transport system substrate-binding protein